MLVLAQRLHVLWLLRWLYESPLADQPITVGGARWRNKFGIAAGFDKHAQVIRALDALGVGAIEVGTVVPKPQEGNPKPRVFRYPQFRAVVNRYGFNSVGVEQFVANLATALRGSKPVYAAIGVSIGKNKNTSDANALGDYLHVFARVLPFLRPNDYVIINISSTNTPGLRDIFLRLYEFLGEFMDGAEAAAHRLAQPMCPVHLKLPPDWDDMHEQVADAVIAAGKVGIEAIQATNTTANVNRKAAISIEEVGGMSGAPLFNLSNEVLERCAQVNRRMLHPLALVGVGGVENSRTAIAKVALGATAVQAYTGLVYQGPGLIHKVLAALEKRR